MGALLCFKCRLRVNPIEGQNIPLCKCYRYTPDVTIETFPCGCVGEHRIDWLNLCPPHLQQAFFRANPTPSDNV